MKKPESKIWFEVWTQYKEKNWTPVLGEKFTPYRYSTIKIARHIAKSYLNITHHVRVVRVKQTRSIRNEYESKTVPTL